MLQRLGQADELGCRFRQGPEFALYSSKASVDFVVVHGERHCTDDCQPDKAPRRFDRVGAVLCQRLTIFGILPPMKTATPEFGMELRHNGEAVGRVCAGAIEVDEDGGGSEVRFWMGLKALRASKSICALPISKGPNLKLKAMTDYFVKAGETWVPAGYNAPAPTRVQIEATLAASAKAAVGRYSEPVTGPADYA